jgi:predicted alpha/beta superfamily hydrolase
MAHTASALAVIDTLDHHASAASRFDEPRNVDVWLPPGYDPAGGCCYAAIYAHDGQNLFQLENPFGGADWGLDETRETIVIGIWNTERRWRERLHVPLRFLLQPTFTEPETR